MPIPRITTGTSRSSESNKRACKSKTKKRDIENSMARAGTVGREEKGEAIY